MPGDLALIALRAQSSAARPALAIVAACLAALTACSSSGPSARPTSPTPQSGSPHRAPSRASSSTYPAPRTVPPAPAGAGTALAALAALRVKGRAPMTGYARSQFGPAWSDDNDEPFGHNGCDTRNDILRRDLHATVIKDNTNGCVALSGRLDDPYAAIAIAFVRGASTSSQVQIDHVVALGDAWQTGAQQWTGRQRQNLANDPMNLLAVDGSANEQKGDSDAASWLPANKSFRCSYVARQVAVKVRYDLWVTQAEGAAIVRVLATCRDQRLPVEPGAIGAVAVRGSAPPSSRPAPVVPPTTAGVYYPNCSAVRAAGKAPLHSGQPGYRAGLDRDGDGVACE
ncbi:MAG TPA: DUF1524 domain-containing protein [Jatrophihabitantaceae bacterium]